MEEGAFLGFSLCFFKSVVDRVRRVTKKSDNKRGKFRAEYSLVRVAGGDVEAAHRGALDDGQVQVSTVTWCVTSVDSSESVLRAASENVHEVDSDVCSGNKNIL